jgi:hypothetical protein
VNYLFIHEFCNCSSCEMARRVLSYDLSQLRERYAKLMTITRQQFDDGLPPVPDVMAEFPMLSQRFYDLTMEKDEQDRRRAQGPV